jgi:hypothetical protein
MILINRLVMIIRSTGQRYLLFLAGDSVFRTDHVSATQIASDVVGFIDA